MKYGISSWLNILLTLEKTGRFLLLLSMFFLVGIGFTQTKLLFGNLISMRESSVLAEKQAVLGIVDRNVVEEEKQIEEKIKYWEAVLYIQPNYKPAYSRLATYHKVLGNVELAEKFKKLANN